MNQEGNVLLRLVLLSIVYFCNVQVSVNCHEGKKISMIKEHLVRKFEKPFAARLNSYQSYSRRIFYAKGFFS